MKCNYCEVKPCDRKTLFEIPRIDIYVNEMGDLTFQRGHEFHYERIEYCPMCGRKL